MPGSTPPTSQLDWLISTTAMIVLFWSRATRDLLKSFGWGIATLHRLIQRRSCHPRRPPHSISPVEGSGFEPWVPPRKRRPWREVPRPTIVVSRDDLSLMTLQVIGPGSPFGNSRETFRKSGTDGSNPLPSSEESQQQTRFRHLRHGGYRARLKMPAGRAPRLSLELQ